MGTPAPDPAVLVALRFALGIGGRACDRLLGDADAGAQRGHEEHTSKFSLYGNPASKGGGILERRSVESSRRSRQVRTVTLRKVAEIEVPPPCFVF